MTWCSQPRRAHSQLDTTHFANVTISSPTRAWKTPSRCASGSIYRTPRRSTRRSALPTLGGREPGGTLFAVTVEDDVQLRNAYSNEVVRTFADVVAEPGQMTFSPDGRSLFVHDLPNLSVIELDVATGAVLGNFAAPVNQYSQQPGAGIAVIRPGGDPVLVTPNTHFYDLTTREEINVGSWSFWGYNSFTASPDQSLLAHEQGGAFRLALTALNGGGLDLDPNYF